MEGVEMSIGIVTIAGGTEEFLQACAPCLESVEKYANRHGYVRFLWDGCGLDRPISWGRIPYMLTIMDERPDLKYLFWIDADAMITNPKITLDSFVAILEKYNKDVLVAVDGANNINDGVAIYRNSDGVRKMFYQMWNMEEYINHPWWANAALHRYVIENYERKEILLINNSNVFNSYIYGRRPWSFGDFIVHFAGMANEKRRLFADSFAKFLNSVEDYLPERSIESFYYETWEN